MARARRLAIAAAIVMLSALPTLPSFRLPDWRAADRSWARGPVWYIMTHEEYGAYRRLKSASARREFIRGFWTLRDPIPDTTENELEQEFWHRVRLADGHFGQDVKPGWKTERGKVFILLGPPENLDDDGILRDTWGASRWVYDLGRMPFLLRLVLQDSLGVPADRRFVSIRVREETEGLRSVARSSTVYTSVLRPTAFLPLAETLVRRVPGTSSLRNLAHVMRVPEVLDRLGSHVHVSTVFSLVPLEARVDFRPAGRGAAVTRAAVTIGVRWSDLSAAGMTSFDHSKALVTGYLTSIDDPGLASRPLSGSYAPTGGRSGDGDPLHAFQAVTRIPPGRYLLDIAYRDTEDRIMGAVREVIEVPAFDVTGLSVSSMILAAFSERTGHPAAAASSDHPFSLGAYRVIPRTSRVYRPENELSVFYEIWGASLDERGRARLELVYQFYVEDSGIWLPVGSPIHLGDASETEQTWGVPLAGWPDGRYRLEVSVTDRIGGETVIRSTLFEIRPDARTAALR